MRIETTQEYIAEVGDKVLILSTKRTGTIESFARHCSACERYANVAIDGKIVACPDVISLQWDSSMGLWKYDE